MHKAKTRVGFDGCLLTITKPWLNSLKTNERLKYSLRWSKQQETKTGKRKWGKWANLVHWCRVHYEQCMCLWCWISFILSAHKPKCRQFLVFWGGGLHTSTIYPPTIHQASVPVYSQRQDWSYYSWLWVMEMYFQHKLKFLYLCR